MSNTHGLNMFYCLKPFSYVEYSWAEHVLLAEPHSVVPNTHGLNMFYWLKPFSCAEYSWTEHVLMTETIQLCRILMD
jgi:hypothetical protein